MPINLKSTSANSIDWNLVQGNEPLIKWISEVNRAINLKDINNWMLAGRALLIINNSPDYVSRCLSRVAEDLDFNYLHLHFSIEDSLPKINNHLKQAPCIVYLDPKNWVNSLGELENTTNDSISRANEIRKHVLNLILKFNPNKPVIYITSNSDITEVNDDIKKVGGFERFLAIPDESFESIGISFMSLVGTGRCSVNLVKSPGKVGKLVDANFESQELRGLAALGLQRLAVFEERSIEFLDLVHIATHDLLEEGVGSGSRTPVRRQTAFHESGHSVISMIESDGLNIPDYTSILPGASGFEGVSVGSYEYQMIRSKDNQTTYKQFRGRIRVLLAGRAGEEIAVGVEQISDGASSDLEQATRMASRYFAKCGFSPSMDQPGNSNANLYVIVQPVSESEQAQLEVMVRQFLQIEYDITLEILRKNFPLLHDVAERLMVDPVVDQAELREIFYKYR